MPRRRRCRSSRRSSPSRRRSRAARSGSRRSPPYIAIRGRSGVSVPGPVAGGRRPFERPLDQPKPQRGQHAPADDQAAEAVQHRGQVQPPLPSGQVGDVSAPQPVGALALKSRSTRSGAHRTPATRTWAVRGAPGCPLAPRRPSAAPRASDRLGCRARGVARRDGAHRRCRQGGVDGLDLVGQERVIQRAVDGGRRSQSWKLVRFTPSTRHRSEIG